MFQALRRLINPRAGYLARGAGRPASAARIALHLALVLVAFGLCAFLLTHLFAAL